jgi:hypothetical protein
MKTIHGSCGLICSECPAYLSNLNNDEELREKTAVEWSAMYGAEIPAAAIDCTGCREVGAKIGHCSECDVRLCAIQKDVATCADCADYACETLNKFFEFVPEVKENLDTLRQ